MYVCSQGVKFNSPNKHTTISAKRPFHKRPLIERGADFKIRAALSVVLKISMSEETSLVIRTLFLHSCDLKLTNQPGK